MCITWTAGADSRHPMPLAGCLLAGFVGSDRDEDAVALARSTMQPSPEVGDGRSARSVVEPTRRPAVARAGWVKAPSGACFGVGAVLSISVALIG